MWTLWLTEGCNYDVYHVVIVSLNFKRWTHDLNSSVRQFIFSIHAGFHNDIYTNNNTGSLSVTEEGCLEFCHKVKSEDLNWCCSFSPVCLNRQKNHLFICELKVYLNSDSFTKKSYFQGTRIRPLILVLASLKQLVMSTTDFLCQTPRLHCYWIMCFIQ